MPVRTQLIFTDNPGELPATYTVPSNSDFQLSSVFARFDGNNAFSDFVPTLDLLSQSGQLMARVAVTQTLVAGDLARVTWAPFLRRTSSSTPPPPSTGLGFCSWRSNVVTTNGSLNGSSVIDMNPATAPGLYTNTTDFAIVNDPLAPGLYGITIPANTLVRVMAFMQIFGGQADGRHEISWLTVNSPDIWGPSNSDGVSSGNAWSPIGLIDDGTAPEAIYLDMFMSDNIAWVVHLFHDWFAWTNRPQDFKYGLAVMTVGAAPT